MRGNQHGAAASASVATYEFPELPRALSIVEQAALQVCEERIRDGLKKFDQVWDALLEIREKSLYREQYSSFEEYCRVKWNFGARRGRQLSDAAMVMKALKAPESYPDGAPQLSLQDEEAGADNFTPNKAVEGEGSPEIAGRRSQIAKAAAVLPTNEKQVRPLTRLKSEKEQREAWREAVDKSNGQQPSARTVREVVEKRVEPQRNRDTEASPDQEVQEIAREALVCLREIDETLGRNRASGDDSREQFGQARYFAGCMRTELERLERLAKEGGGFGGKKNGQAPIVNSQKAKKDAKTKSPEAKTGGFVVCRMPEKGSLQKGPRFGPGRWCRDPRKSQIYDSASEAMIHSKSWDKVMALGEAVRLFEKTWPKK